MTSSSSHSAGSAQMSFAKAINAGLHAVLRDDPRAMAMGEDIGKNGGMFRITDGLHASFGDLRVVDTPLAESGIVGTAIGLAMRGYRPICEIQFDGFVFPAFNQITTQLAKLHYRSRGRINVPVTIRIPYGGHIGAVEHHSESPEALFAHTAGLRIVSPSNPQDAYDMIRAAAASPDPVIYFEPKAHYWGKGQVNLDSEPAAGILDKAAIARPGTDITLVAYGPTVSMALTCADILAQEGTLAEVVDLRALSPLDIPTVVESVNKTGRCIVVHEAPTAHGIGAEVASRVTEAAFHVLEAPVLRVGGFHAPYPVAKVESHYLPSVDRVLDAVDRAFAY